MNSQLHRVIGIDLGTTFSVVATYDLYNKQVKILSNRDEPANTGNPEVTPSVLSLDQALHKVIVGWNAKRNLAADPQNTIIEIKRELGEEFKEQTGFEHSTLDIFDAIGTFNVGDPVKTYFMGQWFLPQEISALILMKMKKIAENEIGEEIHDAVITVPACFTEKQRKATREAALLAGLYPFQLLPAPTAAVIGYGVPRIETERKLYLVYNLGGGTFDVSIIEVINAKLRVIATSGDSRLGGCDFDNAITNWVVEELRRKYQLDIRTDHIAKARIKYLAEEAKIMIGSRNSTVLNLKEIFPQQSPTLKLTRNTFEHLIEKLIEKSLIHVHKAIKLAEKNGIHNDDIDAILLVGGSSKIPLVRRCLLDYFKKDESFVWSNSNPDHVVAHGAAIFAKRFTQSPTPFDICRKDESIIANLTESDTLSIDLISEYALGLEIQDKLFYGIIEQGSTLPIEVTRDGFTNSGPSTDIVLNIYQGEAKYVNENTLIGFLHLGPIDPQPSNFHLFKLTFKLDINNLLSVIVHHTNEGRIYEARFEHKTGIGGENGLIAVHKKLIALYTDYVQFNAKKKVASKRTISIENQEIIQKQSWKSNKLFSYPLPEPENTDYHKLGITPEATPDEIREAKSRIIERLNRQKKEVDKKLNYVYQKIDGLQQVYKDIEMLRGQGEDKNTENLIHKEELLQKLEEDAIMSEPEYKNLRERSQEIERKINEINLMILEKPEERIKYDQKHPPYALLKLESCDQEIFTKGGKSLALFLLRCEVADFLAEHGVECYHPSDLTRKDFLSDFSYNPILDGGIRENSKSKK